MIQTKQIILNSQLLSYYSITSDKNNSELIDPKNAIIWLHGWRSNSNNWTAIIQRILNQTSNQNLQSYQNIAIDFPGFGQSPIPSNIEQQPWTLQQYADTIYEFIRSQKFNKVILVGHSFGGRISMLLASSKYAYKMQDTLGKIILVGSHGFADNSKAKNIKQTIAKIVKPIFNLELFQPLKKIIYTSMGSQDYLATPKLQKTFVNVINQDLSENIKTITVPINMIWGGSDEATPVEFTDRIKALAEQSPIVTIDIIEEAGHYSFLDQSSQFISIFDKII